MTSHLQGLLLQLKAEPPFCRPPCFAKLKWNGGIRSQCWGREAAKNQPQTSDHPRTRGLADHRLDRDTLEKTTLQLDILCSNSSLPDSKSCFSWLERLFVFTVTKNFCLWGWMSSHHLLFVHESSKVLLVLFMDLLPEKQFIQLQSQCLR